MGDGNDGSDRAGRGMTHVDGSGARMVDVAGKAWTARSATAASVVRVGSALAAVIREGRGKKGDALAVAQLAGIQAVKHTATLVPLCHPLPIDGVSLDVSLLKDAEGWLVRSEATVRTTFKTGVEMEALHAASVSALTVIDMGKSVEKGLGISSVVLLSKTGGAGGDYAAASEVASDGGRVGEGWPSGLVVGVLTVSDRASVGAYADRSGPAVAGWWSDRVAGVSVRSAVVGDEAGAIAEQVVSWCDAGLGLVLTTGGTGSSARDVTPEATLGVLDRLHPGLTEHARRVTSGGQPLSCLSRGVAGMRGGTLVVNLPGSPGGALEWLEALSGVLPHALRTLGGDGV